MILLGQGVIGGVLIVLGIAAVAAALLFTAGRSKVQTGENTELSYLEQEMEELETQVCIAEGQVEDFCTRWGLREGLELTSWLVELQNKRRDYEALLERQKQDGSDEKTARIAALQKDLQQFFAEYGEVPETQNYLAALHELAGKCRQRQLLLEKQKKYLQQKQKYEALEEQVKDYFVSLQLIPEEHPEEQLAELESHRKDYEKELQEYRRIEQEIKAFEAKEDIPALLALKVRRERNPWKVWQMKCRSFRSVWKNVFRPLTAIRNNFPTYRNPGIMWKICRKSWKRCRRRQRKDSNNMNCLE